MVCKEYSSATKLIISLASHTHDASAGDVKKTKLLIIIIVTEI